MADEYGNDFITVQDDEGNTHEFEILDSIETEDGRFIALIPVYDDETPEEMLEYDGELIILQVVEENGEDHLAAIEDEDLFNKIFSVFEKRLEEYYEINIEEEN